MICASLSVNLVRCEYVLIAVTPEPLNIDLVLLGLSDVERRLAMLATYADGWDLTDVNDDAAEFQREAQGVLS